jgi:BCD family chlorophyll transporter-like MFS transporter
MSPLSWFGIVRLGLVQAALGGIVVLTTSTMNRVMVVELALPAFLPGALVAMHYLVQALRPRLGYGSDVGGRRVPWIIGGMALLAGGGVAAAFATAWMASHLLPGILLAIAAFLAIGIGVGAAGTSLLTLLSQRVAPDRRAPAATIVWLMMIAGIALTAGLGGRLLDPFSTTRLIAVAAGVGAIALLLTILAVWGAEPHPAAPQPRADAGFTAALREIWAEPAARRFALFVFASMLAYSAQELVLEPFAGAVFALTPGGSAGLAGLQHAGVLAGMVAVALLGRRVGLRACTIAGCTASALAILALAATGLAGPGAPLRPCVMLLGAANGAFAASAIGAMIGLAHQGGTARAGTRMGLWGAAQAIAFGAGGLAGTTGSDLARHLLPNAADAYACVFAAEAILFFAAALLAARVFAAARPTPIPHNIQGATT